MAKYKLHHFIDSVLKHMPQDWLKLTTHRLDIYNEALAKTEFTEEFETLFNSNNVDAEHLKNLPTAYDYIRLGHPLSCILEWSIAKLHDIDFENVISFSSQTMPIQAILRTNALNGKQTTIAYDTDLPEAFKSELLKDVYGYNFSLKQIKHIKDISEKDATVIMVSKHQTIQSLELHKNIDFYICCYSNIGSAVIMNTEMASTYSGAIQHVRRRETIAMTPINTLIALKAFSTSSSFQIDNKEIEDNKSKVLEAISSITKTTTKPLVASSGLSMQYAIMMGLIHYANDHHSGKSIKFLVPPNCYGGTNDQARRVAQSINHVEILDLPVDGDNDMVSSIDSVLNTVAQSDGIPFIIAEIPTNPRVEVPNLKDLNTVLTKSRYTYDGTLAVAPVFILDQTFCPNVDFLSDSGILSAVQAISYASGSKFPSGGKCTAGYAVVNQKGKKLLEYIETHLNICDNEATAHQYAILAEQLPSMNQRIAEAYENTKDFVDFVKETLPEAHINFVPGALTEQGFTPSVFSLDLPTKGETNAEQEQYKRALNLKLITMMITQIPSESKYCVSYGQLNGCYWTVPATSTQGTTKEGDKDYIVRASFSPSLDLDKHKAVFKAFVEEISN